MAVTNESVLPPTSRPRRAHFNKGKGIKRKKGTGREENENLRE